MASNGVKSHFIRSLFHQFFVVLAQPSDILSLGRVNGRVNGEIAVLAQNNCNLLLMIGGVVGLIGDTNCYH